MVKVSYQCHPRNPWIVLQSFSVVSAASCSNRLRYSVRQSRLCCQICLDATHMNLFALVSSRSGLTTRRFYLRHLADPLVSRHLNAKPPASVSTLAEEFGRLAAGPAPCRAGESWVNFAVRLKIDGCWIGRIQTTLYSGWAEIGYLFGPAHWGHGYATESLQWLREYLSNEHHAYELWASVAPANERSVNLLLRAGYQSVPLCDARPLASFEPGDRVFFLQLSNR